MKSAERHGQAWETWRTMRGFFQYQEDTIYIGYRQDGNITGKKD